MIYLEYEVTTKQVVQIHETVPTLNSGYDYAISEDRNETNNEGEIIVNDFKMGDEFEKTIWINEVDENKRIVSYSAVRNNPQAKRLLKENEDLKKDKKMFNLKVDALTNQNEMLESVIQELIMTVIP